MKKTLLAITYKELILALLSGLLLGLSWHKPFTFLIFIGFVPLFLLITQSENLFGTITDKALLKIEKRKLNYLFYIAFITWNLVAYWWLYYVGIVAFLFAVFANSLLMLLPIILYKYIKRKTENKFGLWVFIACWISFEYLHTQNWGFSWTWLNLGNAFGNTPSWVQWYEYTGVFGGSTWVLIINYLVFKNIPTYFITNHVTTSQTNILISWKWQKINLAIVLFVPFSISQLIFYNYQEQGKEVEILVLQPNFDTYTQKFQYNARTGETNTTSYVPFDKQFERFLTLTRQQITNKTALVLLPETAWNDDIDETAVGVNSYISRMSQYRDSFPNLSILTGADSYTFYYNATEKPTPTARYHSPNTYYDVFNTAMFLNTKNETAFYHKSMLVVGVESNPLRSVIGFLQKTVMQNMGNLVGDLGTQSERSVFVAAGNLKVAQIVCYESIYGEYVTNYVKNGANLLCIITNDGWWDDSPAPRQHLSFASLRAIETRRAVARSANTGISAFINQKGEITQQSKYNETTTLRNSLKINENLTIYVRFGDILARFAVFMMLFFLFRTVSYGSKEL